MVRVLKVILICRMAEILVESIESMISMKQEV